ncbi:Probable transcriptional regulatory protein YebC [Aedoeadaptatus ivorii]|uniref:Probable transcriptional regulatory protein NCTC13079_00940 n=1 Tax=Aedoeadaptatus ivorii TaxID=54006 RepID=A0A3S5AJI1_9FIRM|nr:YebC/PmpR family DNA-binding transcriptional regulator [Peptoniphilus ivorii]MDQ0508948.1 YebC/PmpR family DNA-binding regulatory protein [Peptoniphilus ivorii]VEJ35774.1 Probable transcriptional regulatory protein YebC [Peptoniphilus ivorii]
MAGHSKWHNIKNKKGKEDAKRGKIFTKLSRNITVAAREGGDDPAYNAALKAAIDKAKAENMPNDNIDRAIKKAAGGDDGADFEAVTYEGYGPSGIAVLVECLTDNRNRTAPDVRHAFDKNGGNLGTNGSVSFLFDRKGQLGIATDEGIDPDAVMMDAIEAGAEDVTVIDEGIEITTAPEEYHKVRNHLEEKGYEFVISEITFIPQTTTALDSEEDRAKMTKLIEQLESNDDVQEVYHNWENAEEA